MKNNLMLMLNEQHELMMKIIENEGELPELDAMVKAGGEALAVEVDRLVETADGFKPLLDRCSEGKKFWNNHLQVSKNAQERMKENIKYIMGLHGLTELEGNKFKFTLAGSQEKVELKEGLQLSEIPEEFVTKEVVYKINREAVIANQEKSKEFFNVTKSKALRKGLNRRKLSA